MIPIRGVIFWLTWISLLNRGIVFLTKFAPRRGHVFKWHKKVRLDGDQKEKCGST